jgi:putative endonuclease
MSVRADRGALGEALAASFLESRGYRILRRNLRTSRQELDLLVRRGDTLVAVEVKWRRANPVEDTPQVAWRGSQRRRAFEALLATVADDPRASAFRLRFDLVTVEDRVDGWTLTHVRGAWSPADSFW